jgi:hypothetical protein
MPLQLSKADPNCPKTTHSLRSSNFSYYAAVWSTVKTCTSVVAIGGKQFYWIPGHNLPYLNNGRVSSTNGTRQRKRSALADIVCQDGLEWIKVSSITEKRMIWDLAKDGWVGSSGDESEDGNQDDEDDDPRGLLKQIEALLKASRATIVRYRHPTVRLVLPRIKSQPDTKQVANVLQQIRDLGVVVQTSEEVLNEVSPVATVLTQLAPDRFEWFSETLNIDCTVLLAFASDLSHGRVDAKDWHNKAVSRQIEMESEDQLLPSSLWPACGARELVCTREAAVRMLEIVDTIGTETEKKRAALILAVGEKLQITRKELLEEFQKLTDYPVPPEWRLPIAVVDVDVTKISARLPSVCKSVSKVLTSINQSVFLSGWAEGRTTISSNRTVAKEIQNAIEENRASDETRGPDIWLTPMSRSLVGKEKQRRGANGHDPS